jgi:hypothetical protein
VSVHQPSSDRTPAVWLDDLPDLIPYGGLGVKAVVGLA